MFEIHMGVPEMEEFWNALTEKVSSGKASKSEVKLCNLIGKAMVLLANDPRHPGLQSLICKIIRLLPAASSGHTVRIKEI